MNSLLKTLITMGIETGELLLTLPILTLPHVFVHVFTEKQTHTYWYADSAVYLSAYKLLAKQNHRTR